ncbi:MAG: uracil-DNA glycosylase [Nitrospiraceae bacterium]|nr:MAG: uracil-DNA glycosylase [Nitrospiraceae bacterium]
MNNRNEIIARLKKSLEFYRELGFEYLPVKIEKKFKSAIEQKSQSTEVQECRSAKVQKTESTKVQKLKTAEAGNIALDREAALKALREEIGDCKRCKLSGNRKNIVFGEGSPDARLMFIGEGPGRDEDIQGRPFVGEAGQLLTRMITKLGLRREEVYIANIVKCRPPNNREPEEDEIATCRPFVERQIEIISPAVIVSLGRISAQSLLRVKTAISRLRGNFIEYNNVPVMPTFHPAYLLRNPKDKWKTWDDMQKVLERLGC